MRTYQIVILIIVVVILAIAILVYSGNGGASLTPTPTPSPTISIRTTSTPTGILPRTIYRPASAANNVRLISPGENSLISSPLRIIGEARTWYFEASFPVMLVDSEGKVLVQGQAVAQGDWMTTNFVPFVAELSFPAQAAGSRGFLILLKDNPSGLPQNDASMEIPIFFK